MTYRGIVSNGVVILEDPKPLDGTVVEVTPLAENSVPLHNPAAHPAIGIWKDRHDLPPDAVEASHILRERLMRSSND